MTNPITSEEEKNLIDEVCDGLIERLGVEPDGHNTWAKTTDEIVKEVREELGEKLPALLQSQKEKVVEMCESMKFSVSALEGPWDDGYNAGLSDLQSRIKEGNGKEEGEKL